MASCRPTLWPARARRLRGTRDDGGDEGGVELQHDGGGRWVEMRRYRARGAESGPDGVGGEIDTRPTTVVVLRD